MPKLTWRDWDESTFQEARELDRPVLLYLTASWCRFCKSVEEEVFEDEEVVRLVERLYVPVHVDKDRRPDVDQRHNLGGWPTVAFLTPDGDLITGGLLFDVEAVTELLLERARGEKRPNP